jgi:hypothetical protein
MLETHVFKTFVDREALKRWGPLDQGATAGTHLRKVQSILGWAGNAEIGIWVLWLALAHGLGQPVAAAVLLVLMHVKHHIETVTVRDMPFSLGLFSIKGTFSSAMEVGGAVACLALIRDGHPAWGAVALGLGLLIEHAILIDVLHWELTSRDIRLPRDARWKPPARPSRLAAYASSHFPALWKLVQRIKPLHQPHGHQLSDRSRGAAPEPVEHDGALHVLGVAHRSHVQRAPSPTGSCRSEAARHARDQRGRGAVRA